MTVTHTLYPASAKKLAREASRGNLLALLDLSNAWPKAAIEIAKRADGWKPPPDNPSVSPVNQD